MRFRISAKVFAIVFTERGIFADFICMEEEFILIGQGTAMDVCEVRKWTHRGIECCPTRSAVADRRGPRKKSLLRTISDLPIWTKLYNFLIRFPTFKQNPLHQTFASQSFTTQCHSLQGCFQFQWMSTQRGCRGKGPLLLGRISLHRGGTGTSWCSSTPDRKAFGFERAVANLERKCKNLVFVAHNRSGRESRSTYWLSF